jgi:phosphoglycolate phosphatase-like HAD superfamily hydrolase
MRTLLLFDIDGTLVLTGRAGLRALNRAFEDATGVAGATT